MIYSILATAVLGMFGYMFWGAAYAMRRERIRNQREATRGRHAFTRIHRARMLLRRAFGEPEEEVWQPAMLLEQSGGRPAPERREYSPPRH
ncbi:MAG: hypothetical protein JWL74_1019 [Alphaproteobacteria bacterium]|jgi:hypothetical protein|nr:hypothetical protein [Alphaproteobacteria bacterium]